MGVPVDFLAIPSLVAIAGCIGKDAALRPDRCNIRWTERPAFWGGIIAQKGTIKSSSIIIAANPLRAAEAQYREWWKEQMILWQEREDARQASKKGGKKRGADDGPGTGPPDDPRPPEPHMVTDDCTIEALGEAMVTSRGMTWISDELSGWVDNMSRYSKGNDRQFYLKCHSGGEHMIGRIKRGWQRVPDCYLNVIGGIQPAVAKSAFSLSAKAVDDGFFERFGLLAFPDLPEWNRSRQPPPAADYYREYREACIRLAKCNWADPALLGGQPMIFSGEAQERFDKWLDHHMSTRVLVKGASERGDHGFLAKGKGLVPRLAIVLHLYRWTSGDPSAEPRTVDLQSLNSAIGIFEIYCVPTYARILQAFGQVKGHSGATRIAVHIKAKKLTLIRIGDISKMRWEGLRERADIVQAFEVLEDLDWITPPEKPKSGPKGGRPSEAWHVNPRVHAS
jgi:putative DNA primase/helicase